MEVGMEMKMGLKTGMEKGIGMEMGLKTGMGIEMEMEMEIGMEMRTEMEMEIGMGMEMDMGMGMKRPPWGLHHGAMLGQVPALRGISHHVQAADGLVAWTRTLRTSPCILGGQTSWGCLGSPAWGAHGRQEGLGMSRMRPRSWWLIQAGC